MTLDLLSLFVAVAETASFSDAARKLGVPKSTVSRGIARLEAEMGVQLVHRTTRRVSLSAAGTALYQRVAPPLSALRNAMGELAELEDEPKGEVRVTAAVDFGATVLADILTEFTARYPGVKVQAYVTNRVVDLVAEGIDLAFRISTRRLKDSSLTARRATPIAMQLCASPGYLARRGVPRAPRDLVSHEWVGFRGAGPLRLLGPGETATVDVEGRIVCDDMFFVRQVLRAGAGIGLLPSYLVERDVASGRLDRVLPKWEIPSGHLWIVLPGSKHVPRKVAALRDFALEALRGRGLGLKT